MAHVLPLLRPRFCNLRERRVRDKPRGPAASAGAFENSILCWTDCPLVSQRLAPPGGVGRVADYSDRVKVKVKVMALDFIQLSGRKCG